MATVIYPQEIQNILEALNNGTDWTDVYQQLPRRDRELTECLCSLDCSDFITLDGSDAFLFSYNEQADVWDVTHIGIPVYHVEPEMVGCEVDFDDFLTELRYELPGVTVERGSALSNASSEFVNQFKTKLETAFQTALDNL